MLKSSNSEDFNIKKNKYVCGIFKKKLNLLKQNYYEEISTIVFLFFSLGEFLFAKCYPQKTPKGA